MFVRLVCLFLCVAMSLGLDVGLTLNIPAGIMECMHQHLEKGVEYEVEYQVIDGGELDVNFAIANPSQVTLVTDFRKKGNVHKREATETGDHRFCIDNSFSHFANKVVYFEIYANDGKDDEIDEAQLFGDLPEDDGEYEVKLDDIKVALDRIKEHLQKSTQAQRLFSAVESRDRSVLEHNFERVNFWSVVQLVIMVLAGLVNIVAIRRMFTDTSRPAKITKMRT